MLHKLTAALIANLVVAASAHAAVYSVDSQEYPNEIHRIVFVPEVKGLRKHVADDARAIRRAVMALPAEGWRAMKRGALWTGRQVLRIERSKPVQTGAEIADTIGKYAGAYYFVSRFNPKAVKQ